MLLVVQQIENRKQIENKQQTNNKQRENKQQTNNKLYAIRGERVRWTGGEYTLR